MEGCYETPGKKHWGLSQGRGVGSEGTDPRETSEAGLSDCVVEGGWWEVMGLKGASELWLAG